MTKLAILLALTMANALEIRHLYNEPILTLRKGSCRVQKGTIKLVHVININKIEDTVNYLSQLAFKMTDTSIRNLLENKVNTVQNNLLQIKPTVWFRRWDTIGHVLK